LGYDLEAVEAAKEDYGGDCPCCQIEALMNLLLDERERMYRKGWQHIVDGETPPVPDLLFSGEKLRAEDLDEIARQGKFCDDQGNLLKPKE
jgi:hypothetical protein